MADPSADRGALKAKIAALRARTRLAGCSEAEALTAAAMAAELMARHGLSEVELEMTEAEAVEPTTRATWRRDLLPVIAGVTNSAAILLGRTGGRSTILFIGREPGPEIAVYLRDVCVRAIEAEIGYFKASPFYKRRRAVKTKRAAVQDFADGMVVRLAGRLRAMFAASHDIKARDRARQALDARFPDSEAMRRRARETQFDHARAAGWQAGGAVPLHHGVGDRRAAAPKLIGGARG